MNTILYDMQYLTGDPKRQQAKSIAWKQQNKNWWKRN